MRISLVGIPGAGKTTLATLLGSITKTMHISSGELARAHGFAGSSAEKSGQLDPDEGKIRNLVQRAIGDSNAYILDGFPRMIDQIESVELPLDAVLYLEVGHWQIGANRLLERGRPDDTEDIIKARLKTYFKHTYPLVEYFDNKGILISIDASGTIADTLARAVLQLAKIGMLELEKYVKGLIDDKVFGTANYNTGSNKGKSKRHKKTS